jgi:hypothetical protein
MSEFPNVQRDWTDEIDPATGNRIAWAESPALAYRKGLDDGVRLGYEQALRELFEGFKETIGATGSTTLRQAMSRQIATMEAADRRREWDRTASLPRPGDFRGRQAA